MANPTGERTTSAADLPAEMAYVECDGAGGPEVMRVARGPLPTLQSTDVLIRVGAAGINRVDVQQRRGGYKPPPGATAVLGVEVAGLVVALGRDVTTLRVGDRVCALVEGGGYAAYCAAHERQCLPWPRGFDAVQAAALPETYFTVWANLFHTGCLRPGETLLVHGGTSGIGTTAIQLARAFGARVLATAGSADKCAACVRLGADAAIDYRGEDFVARVDALTEGRGVDVVLDIVGGPYVARNLRCLARRGRLVMIAFLEGSVADKLDFGRLLVRHLTVTGSTLRPRSAQEKGELADALRTSVWPMLDEGRCLPVIDGTFPLDRVREAHARMEASVHVGKIMLVTP
jgi:NADPH:quinone reductase